MKKSALFVVFLLIGGHAAATDIDKTIDADAKGQVSVSIISGSIQVIGWDRDAVRVVGSYEDDVESFIFERDGKDVTIKVKAPDRGWGKKDIDANLVINVPHDNSLDIGTVSADIDVEGVRNEQDLQSVSGDIKTQAYKEDIEAGTVSGDVEVESVVDESTADWSLSSVSGNITAKGLSGELRAETVSGELELDGGMMSRLHAESVNGDVTFEGGLEDGGRIEMETVNGSIDLSFTSPVSARFDVETFNGRIRNCFGPEPERTSKYAPGLELSFSEGDGDGRVSLSTLNGGISICRQ